MWKSAWWVWAPASGVWSGEVEERAHVGAPELCLSGKVVERMKARWILGIDLQMSLHFFRCLLAVVPTIGWLAC
jgi:hypothetical protein